MTNALTTLRLFAAHAAFAATRSERASATISDLRLQRRIARMEREHLRAGGRVVTVRQGGMVATSLEG